MPFKILSWNINGIRSSKADFKELLDSLNADIICFQETKITRDMLEEPLAIVEGYSSYFSFSRKRSGYSGVATFCKVTATPVHAQDGLAGLVGSSLKDNAGSADVLHGHWTDDELKALDSEGRAVITQHEVQTDEGMIITVAVINVYCPRADPEKPERQAYKMKFYELVHDRATAIRESGCRVVITGDINTAHHRIDHCDPDDDFEDHPGRIFLNKILLDCHKDLISCSVCRVGTSGTRSILNDVHEQLEGNGCSEETNEDCGGSGFSRLKVVDTFRYFHPHEKDAFTCWNTFTNARSTNYGTRIDYVLCDKEFLPYLNDSRICSQIMGSDHCPVLAEVKGSVKPSSKLPLTCTKYFLEFQGQQQKISSYFQNASQRPTGLLKKSSEILEETASVPPENLVKRRSASLTQASLPAKRACKETKHKQAKLSSFFTSVKRDAEGKFYNNVTESDSNLIEISENENFEENLVLSCDSEHSGKCEVSETAKRNTFIETSNICEQMPQTTSVQQLSFSDNETQRSKSRCSKDSWSFLMQRPKPPPLCPGHREPAAVRTVKKKGPNYNRQFYACARGAGKEGDPNAQCKFFKWL